MRCLVMLTLLLLTSPLVFSQDNARERKVKVALALSKVKETESGNTKPSLLNWTCGICEEPIEKVREQAKQTGQLVVVFVGGCGGKAKELPKEVLVASVTTYPNDGVDPPTKRRAVILGKLKDKDDSLYIINTIPPEANLKEEVVKALKQLPNPPPTLTPRITVETIPAPRVLAPTTNEKTRVNWSM